MLKPFRYVMFRNKLKAETLGAGQYCGRNLFLLRGSHYEHHMRRRFLKSFQQSIERALGKHVDFIKYVDFIFIARRSKVYLLHYNAAHIVYGSMENTDIRSPSRKSRS